MKYFYLGDLLFLNNTTKAFCCVLLLFSSFGPLKAQEAVVSSGNTLFDSGNSVSYSVGQVVQNTITGTGGFAFQGIQFYFSEQTLSAPDFDTHTFVAIYPNPTSSILNLQFNNWQEEQLFYKLYNLQGQLLFEGSITADFTEISIGFLPHATYLLSILNSSNQSSKTFKIIKN